MSAISGICYWDGRVIADSALAIMASHSQAAGPDGTGTVKPNAGLALQVHRLHFDRLSTLERQPYVLNQGSVLTWDGRLDSREDLLIALHHDLGPDHTDVALVAAAYERWGIDSFARLIGDWSLAIWDAQTQRIVLARDYMGNRPLHYLEVPGGLAWATNLDALADCFDLYRSPDECYIAGRLAGNVPVDLTPFTGARVLRAGHQLVASQESGVDVRRYWIFQPSTLRYHDPLAYTDHLRTLLTEAVRVRLRSSRRVWSHLSGGLDSSSIVCLAHTLIQRGQVEAPGLQPISSINSASPESDESTFIGAVERWCDLTSVKREFSDPYPRFSALIGRRRPFADTAENAFEAPMAAAGDRIVLSGEMGDLAMLRGSSFEDVSLLEPLHNGRLLQFLRLSFARARRQRRPLPFLLGRVALMAYFPRLSKALQTQTQIGSRARDLGMSVDDLLDRGVTPALLARAPRPDNDAYPSLSAFPVAKRRLLSGIYRMTDHGASSNFDHMGEIWRTFPFTHRPLIEFVLAVPQLALWDPLVTRAGMKQALTDVLPPDILRRTSKASPVTAQARRAVIFAEERASFLPKEPAANWRLVTRGYLRADSLQRDVDRLANGAPRSFLRTCIHIEAWLRAVERPDNWQTNIAPSEGLSRFAEDSAPRPAGAHG